MAITQQVKEFEEKVISIDRVTRVVKGGRRFRFRATVVIGDGHGRVGVGVGKGGEVMTSIAKAVSKAKRNMIKVPLSQLSIPHEIEVHFSGARVLLKPAAPGTGVIAGGSVRSVVEAAGIHDLLSKSLGSSNKINNAYATILALSQLQAKRPPAATKTEAELSRDLKLKPAAAKTKPAEASALEPKATKPVKKAIKGKS